MTFVIEVVTTVAGGLLKRKPGPSVVLARRIYQLTPIDDYNATFQVAHRSGYLHCCGCGWRRLWRLRVDDARRRGLRRLRLEAMMPPSAGRDLAGGAGKSIEHPRAVR